MSAVRLDQTIFDNRDWSLEFFWYDSNDALIDVSGYGAILVVKEELDVNAKELIKSTHQNDISIGGANGRIAFTVPAAKTSNLAFETGYWELVIFPTAATPTSGPIEFMWGEVVYRRTLAKLEL